MRRLARFQKKSIIKEYKVQDENGKDVIEKIEFVPYKTPDMELLLDFQKGIQDRTNKDFSENVIKPMIKRVMKFNYPDITDEEFETDYKLMDYSYVDDMLLGIMDANSSGNAEQNNILEEIKNKQKKSITG